MPPSVPRREACSDRTDAAGVAMAVVVDARRGRRRSLVRRDGSPRAIAGAGVGAVDTVGAGDTFVGALAADLAAGRDLVDAAARAVAAASLSTTRRGARGGMPSADELEALPRRALTGPPSTAAERTRRPRDLRLTPASGGWRTLLTRALRTGALRIERGEELDPDDRQRGPAATPPNGSTRAGADRRAG